METKKQKAVSVGIAAIIFMLVVVVLIAVLKKPTEQVNPFADCQVLADSCKDKDCRYLFLCKEAEFSDCQVYDCGENYGVLIKDKNGETSQKTVAKPNQTKVQEMIAKCSGSFEVIEKNNCENGEARAKIKLDARDDCKILSATMAINGKTRIASVEQNGEFYNITVKSCGEISDIKITGEGGVGIREKVEVSEEESPENMMEHIMEERFHEEFSEGELPEAEM